MLGKGEHGVSCLFGLCNVLITSLSLLFARFDPYQVFEVSVCNKMAGLISPLSYDLHVLHMLDLCNYTHMYISSST